MYRDVISNELFTVLMVIAITAIAAAKLVAPQRFNDFIYVLGNSKYLKIYSKDQKFLDKFDALLFSNLIISGSVFIYLIYQNVTETKIISINILFKLVFGIATFILIKVLVERLIASLFEIDKLIDQYLFQKISYKNYLGLLLLPINALLIFSVKPTLPIFYVIITLLLIVNIFGVITSFKTHQNTIKPDLLHFILYLCALEIAPYIILYKVFTS
ncbi:DUF4271 domain-containing protein [Sabulilitoribacter arenilitoris]|uniref:DUF4271 domain-containing protein n=1 Tax=Wocania arenilitoris TaxID=2044858 RepID=A0AAE3EN16_9FLAO|nr:DUF4271 domain-containing protein [Wocania arenilitoris]MCF7568400.1 DUF4271 domain-containing protein [Wocania arenilitoris]